MKKLIIILMTAGMLFATDAPSTVKLDASDQAERNLLDSQVQTLTVRFEKLRTNACWKAGISPAKCGPWSPNSNTDIMITPDPPKPQPAKSEKQ